MRLGTFFCRSLSTLAKVWPPSETRRHPKAAVARPLKRRGKVARRMAQWDSRGSQHEDLANPGKMTRVCVCASCQSRSGLRLGTNPSNSSAGFGFWLVHRWTFPRKVKDSCSKWGPSKGRSPPDFDCRVQLIWEAGSLLVNLFSFRDVHDKTYNVHT